MLRLFGLPAFISWEIINAGDNYCTSCAKAQDELGWTHRSAEQMWLDTIDAELELKEQRTKRGIVSMLKPL